MHKLLNSIYFDLKKTKLVSSDYIIRQSNKKDKILLQVSSPDAGTFIVADTDEAIRHWQAQGLPVIAWSHENNSGESLMGAHWMILSPDALTEDYLREIHCRFYGLPLNLFETKRCKLRELTLEDLSDLIRLDQEQDIHSAGRFFPMSNEKTHGFYEEYLTSYIKNQYSFYGFGIYAALSKTNGHFLGIAGFSATEEAELEIGYAVLKEKQGRGYATEWVSALMKYAEEKLETTDVIARIDSKNPASLRVAGKCGVKTILL